MGQAKQRGSFEQRKALAVERDYKIAKLRVAHERTSPTQKESVTTTALMGLIAGAMMR